MKTKINDCSRQIKQCSSNYPVSCRRQLSESHKKLSLGTAARVEDENADQKSGETVGEYKKLAVVELFERTLVHVALVAVLDDSLLHETPEQVGDLETTETYHKAQKAVVLIGFLIVVDFFLGIERSGRTFL